MRENVKGVVSTQTAQRDHICDGCPQWIVSGQEYRRVFTHERKVLKFHPECYADVYPKQEVKA